MRAPWEWFRLDLETFFEEGDRGAAGVRFVARGLDSGVETNILFGHSFRFSEGQIVFLAAMRTVEEALEAAGLSE